MSRVERNSEEISVQSTDTSTSENKPPLMVDGSMTYPEAEMRFVWDGRGTRGRTATLTITEDEIQLAPRKTIRRMLGWPELTIPRNELETVERLWFGRYRFSSHNRHLDGTCFRPAEERDALERRLSGLGLQIADLPPGEKLRAELQMTWNQMRWGGRRRSAEVS